MSATRAAEGTHGANNGMEAYLLLEAAFCDCEALCICGWDDDDS